MPWVGQATKNKAEPRIAAVFGLFSKKRIPTGIKLKLKSQMQTGHNTNPNQ
jgi:hypothetical protein